MPDLSRREVADGKEVRGKHRLPPRPNRRWLMLRRELLD
jgi:hypothetical protein